MILIWGGVSCNEYMLVFDMSNKLILVLLDIQVGSKIKLLLTKDIYLSIYLSSDLSMFYKLMSD